MRIQHLDPHIWTIAKVKILYAVVAIAVAAIATTAIAIAEAEAIVVTIVTIMNHDPVIFNVTSGKAGRQGCFMSHFVS